MVNDILVQPDTNRDADALKLAENGLVWPVVTLKTPWGAFPAGTEFYAVPSRSNPGASYLANHVSCQCKDYKRAICAHIRAVRLYQQRAVRPARQGYATLYGFCGVNGCQEDRRCGSDYCDAHQLVDAF